MSELIDARKLSEHIPMHPRSLIRMAKEGRLPYKKVGRKYFFDLEEVQVAISRSSDEK